MAERDDDDRHDLYRVRVFNDGDESEDSPAGAFRGSVTVGVIIDSLEHDYFGGDVTQ